MVTDLTNRSSDVGRSARIIEVAGPAGAGKSTLASRLSQSDPRIVVAPDLQARRMEQFPTLLSNTPFLLSIYADRFFSGRRFSWEETKYLMYLHRWPQVLENRIRQSDTQAVHSLLLLDHGPVFKLATLLAFGAERIQGTRFDRWWRETIRHWSHTLDAVIWIDAEDTDLRNRINSRSQRHAVKQRPRDEVSGYLNRYRTAYRTVLHELTESGTPKLLRFDSSRQSLDEIKEECLHACLYPHQ